jgi:hypothetical protein
VRGAYIAPRPLRHVFAPRAAHLASPVVELRQQSVEIVDVSAKLVHLTESVRDLAERAGRITVELPEALLETLELGAQNQPAGPTFFQQLP